MAGVVPMLVLAALLPLLCTCSSSRSSLAPTVAVCPRGYYDHAPGYWNNSIPGPPGHPASVDRANGTVRLCAAKCSHTPTCVAFSVYGDGVAGDGACYIYLKETQLPFVSFDGRVGQYSRDCVASSYTPPPPPPPPPPRPPTHGATFPRLGNCWGSDPYITDAMWDYTGYSGVTNATWARYDTLYLNPFDSCCWLSEIDSWTPRVAAIKQANAKAVVLATFHATEIWSADLAGPNPWLPDDCLMRNADGTVCSWWVGLVFSNNMFRPKCLKAAVDNALSALEPLVKAGIDGVFLDGVVEYNLGCHAADVNCTTPSCKPTPQKPYAELEAAWVQLYVSWFAQLKAKYPKLIWVNNLDPSLQPTLLPLSNGRMYEGSAVGALDPAYSGQDSITSVVDELRQWSTAAVQPSYVHMSMNSGELNGQGWRIGRWQNLVSRGEMMRMLTDFRRMRFGLGVTLMTDGYFANDLGGGFYGVPTWYTEYEAKLGQALADPVRVFAIDGSHEEVWMREFEFGFAVVSSLASSNYTVKLPRPVVEIPLSSDTQALTDGREAPAWQFYIDNDAATARGYAGGPARVAPHGGGGARMLPTERELPPSAGAEFCECSPATPACCTHASGHPQDWWAEDARRASFAVTAGNWTTVADAGQSHQMGPSFLVSFFVPGLLPQGFPPAFSARWTFVSPATGAFHLSLTAVDAHLYPLTDGAKVCVAEHAGSTAQGLPDPPCIMSGTVDQRGGLRDGYWQRALTGVEFRANVSYSFTVAMDQRRGGYVAVDALLVESERLYHEATAVPQSTVVVGAMDSRILLK